jgi:hypothetical protein
MIGVQGILANNRNVINESTNISASSVKAVLNAVRRLPTTRIGNGFATLSGNYTGQVDAIYDVEIVNEIATQPLISAPSFFGQGNGQMTAVSFTGAAQTFVVELTDLGTALVSAGANVESVKIVARVPGAAGNAIKLEVSEAGLTFTETPFSLISDLKSGAKSGTSNAFDWQSAVVGPDKVIPSTAKRVAFGSDRSNIYYQYKTFDKSAWTYNFEPAIARDVSKGTPVYFVTGGRTVTITDGTTTETFTNIVSIFDLLNAIQTGSALVKVEGVVANDRRPGGQGVKELTLRTQAYLAENGGTGSAFAKGFEEVAVNVNAFTETIEARCYAVSTAQAANASLGHELWELRGSLSGLLRADLATDETYTEPSGRFTLKIPKKLPPGFGVPRGRFSVTGINYVTRQNPSAQFPPICTVAMNLGPNAVDQQITLRYRQRPSAGCDCSALPVPDTNTTCLGLEGVTEVSVLAERIISAYNFRKNFYLQIYDSNTPYANLFPDVQAFLANFETDFDFIVGVLKELVDVPSLLLKWDELYQDFVTEAQEVITVKAGGGGVPVTQSFLAVVLNQPYELLGNHITNFVLTDNANTVIPSGVYTLDDVYGVLTVTGDLTGFVLPFRANYDSSSTRTKVPYQGFFAWAGDGVYPGTIPGPWVDLAGVDVQDVRFKGPADATNYEIDQFNGAVRVKNAAYITPLLTTTNYAAFDKVISGAISLLDFQADLSETVPGLLSGLTANDVELVHVRTDQAVAIPADKFSVEPSVVLNNFSSLISTRVVVLDVRSFFDAPKDYPSTNYSTYVVRIKSGFTGTPKRDIVNNAVRQISYTVPRVNQSGSGGGTITLTQTDYNERREAWQEWADAIRADAGKFDANTGEQQLGDGCWRDAGDSFYWEVTGSVGGSYQPAFNNRPYYSSKNNTSTKEFAFQLNIKCTNLLQAGDSITLAVGEAGLSSTYQINDSLVLSTVASQPLQLAGGQDGTNTQTWVVSGSVVGALPAYPLVTSAPTAYNQNGLGFQITPGAIPYEKGDKYTFLVEGGHWRWRKNAGAWSNSATIGTAPAALADGLSLAFATGVAPSFRAGDLFSFRALQPYAPVNIRRPTPLMWRWEGAAATLDVTLGATQSITALAVLHRLPVGAAVTVRGGVGNLTDWAETFTATSANLLARFVTHTANRIQIEVADAIGGAIDWVWAGTELFTEYSAEISWARDYHLEHGAGFNPGALYLGKAGTGEIKWNELMEADRVKVEEMLDHVKKNGDEPLIIFPQRLRPNEAMLARIVPDEIMLEDSFSYQPDQAADRRYNLTLPVKGVFL